MPTCIQRNRPPGPHTAFRQADARGLLVTAMVITALILVSASVATAQRLPERQSTMLEAVIVSFDTKDRQVYVAPSLGVPEGLLESQNMAGQIRHSPEHLELVKERFEAIIQQPGLAILCQDRSRPETCWLPGDGILFEFMLPSPMQDGKLPVRVVVYHDARGENDQILREAWDLLVARHPQGGWAVEEKELFAVAHGPG